VCFLYGGNMFRTMFFLIMVVFGFTNIYATETHELIERTYNFKPNEPLLISNPAFWEITMNCKVSTNDQSDDLYAVMKKKSGKINGIELRQGQSMTTTVSNGDIFKISAKSGSIVEITNYGSSLVTTKCRT
jgi:hypothetical protein